MKWLLGKLILTIFRWKAVGDPPPKKCVVIAAPHTSNWDFVFTMALAWSQRIKIRWLGKHSLFRFPYGLIMKALGGIPVRRYQRNDLVNQTTELIRNTDKIRLLIAVESTRKRTEYWKSGFVHIARAADVPIALGFLDFEKKTGGFGPAVDAQQSDDDLMAEIRAFYADKKGKHPEQFGPVRFRGSVTALPGAKAKRDSDEDSNGDDLHIDENVG